MAKAAPPKALTKTQIVANIAETTGLTKKEVGDVFDALSTEIGSSLGNKGAGQFTIPGLCKITLKDVPAKPKRKGRNPSNGEEIWLAPKPASKKLTIRPEQAFTEEVDPQEVTAPDTGDSQDTLRMQWIDAIRSRVQPVSTIELGTKIMVIVDLATRSMWTGKAYGFDPVKMRVREI